MTRPARQSDPQRRYVALVEAIRDHESRTAHPSVPKRRLDHVLYRRLAAVEASPPVPGDQ